MQININDIKNGMTIIMDGNLCSIQEFQHVKPGKGPAFVRIKLKNLRTGSLIAWALNKAANKSRIIRQKTATRFIAVLVYFQ